MGRERDEKGRFVKGNTEGFGGNTEKARECGRKGGVASGESKREHKTIAQVLRKVLDEPMSGIDAVSVRFMEEMIQEYVRVYHKTVIMITHNARQAQELCDRIVHLHGAAGGK